MYDGNFAVVMLILCIIGLMFVSFVVGKDIQASYCYRELADGSRYVVIKEQCEKNYYLLGDKLDKEPEKVFVVKEDK
jgi:hypothetical protein